MSTSEVFSAPPSISSACPVIVPANLLALRPPRSATIISFAKPSSISANQVPSRWLSTRSQPRHMRWPMWPSRWLAPLTASRSSTRTSRALDRPLRVAQVFSTSSRNLALIMSAFFSDRMPVAWLATTRTGSRRCAVVGLFRAICWATTMAGHRPDRLQRPSTLGSEGYHERGRAPLPAPPDARGAIEQGPPRRAVQPRADRLCTRTRRRGWPSTPTSKLSSTLAHLMRPELPLRSSIARSRCDSLKIPSLASGSGPSGGLMPPGLAH